MTSASDADRRRFAGSFAHRARAVARLANGVSSSPRAAQRPAPLAIARADGAHVFDVDGRRYVDCALGYGALILGHTPPAVLAALQAELAKGLRTATVHAGEAELAELIADCVPSAELSSFVSTGTEAVQLALRIARATTGRTRIVKFRANYHGWFDSVHVANAVGDDGAGALGQDEAAARSLTVLDWGDAAALETALDARYAAVLVEPAAMNAGCFAPPPGFLERLRAATRRHGAMLIFDEVITGFRLALGGAQERYGVLPDLTVLGKALGAGLPISAVAGDRAAMAVLAEGRLSHRGTFNGQPVCVAAAVAALRTLQAERTTLYPRIEGYATRLCDQVNAQAAQRGLELCARSLGPALQIFAGRREAARLADTATVDRAGTIAFTADLLREGLHTLPRGLCYVSAAHTAADIEQAEAAIAAAAAASAAMRAA